MRKSPINIRIAGSIVTRRAPADAFTGAVWHDPIIDAPAPTQVRAARITFEPSARIAWHMPALGQPLHVLSGIGRVQPWGGPVREIPPGEKHWHGGPPDIGVLHLAMQEVHDGPQVTWMEHVTNEQDNAAPEPEPGFLPLRSLLLIRLKNNLPNRLGERHDRPRP